MAADLEARIVSLNRVMRAHRGGVQLLHTDDRGTASVAFTGMCTGCTYRPVCAETIVRPALDTVPGVEDVDIRGTRVDEGNWQELRTSLAPRPRP